MKKRIDELFRKLVSIDSPSGREQKLKDLVADILSQAGFKPEDSAHNLIARRGQGIPLLLCCHLDTVASNAELKLGFVDGEYYSKGDTILGADDKAGIAALLACVEQVPGNVPIELIFSVREELGMEGTKALDPSILRARWGLVLDAGEPVGTVINSAPGESRLEFVVLGKAAHAAVDPGAGIDAMRAAAACIVKLPSPRLDEHTSYNLGLIRGGEATNSVCARVEIIGDIRGDEVRRAEAAEELRRVAETVAKDHGAKLEFKINELYKEYRVASNHPLIHLLKECARPVGVQVDVHSRASASDANILNGYGLTVVNLGTGYQGGHSPGEKVPLAEMDKLARWLYRVLEAWVHGSA